MAVCNSDRRLEQAGGDGLVCLKEGTSLIECRRGLYDCMLIYVVRAQSASMTLRGRKEVGEDTRNAVDALAHALPLALLDAR